MMKLKFITWIPAVFIMVVIFNFSAKSAAESDGSSLQITNVFLNLYESIHDGELSDNYKENLLLQANHVIRKMAHAIEYVVLSLCIGLHLLACRVSSKRLFLFSIIISGIYAITDEFHQLFVPGRCGRISDVLIDTVGAMIGAAFFLFVLRCFQKRGTR